MKNEPFLSHRSLLFTVAYEMLGSAADAEDVVQETWLRWDGIDDAAWADIRDPRAYLIRMVTRQALNRLRTQARQREDYVGAWLPEPLLTSPDLADDLELAESVSISMLHVLETLRPAERAVFVLREVFDLPFDEIAEAVGKSSAAVRQIAHRARQHVAARRPRVEVSHAERRRVVERFLASLTTGDVRGLMDVLAPEVVLVADGGGKVTAILRPIEGRDRVMALLSRYPKFAEGREVATTLLNGALAARIDPGGEFDSAISFAMEDGRITAIFVVRNPDKLGRLEEAAELRR